MDKQHANEDRGMYREVLLDYYKNPRNFHALKNPDIHKQDSNPMCGDEVEIFANVEETNDDSRSTDSNAFIKEISFKGKGCVICMATSSMLMEYCEGKKLSEIQHLGSKELLELLDIELTPTRLKCAMLPLLAIKKGIVEFKSK